MQPSKQRLALYAILLIFGLVVCSTAIANPKIYGFITDVISLNDETFKELTTEDKIEIPKDVKTSFSSIPKEKISKQSTLAAPAAMFATIINGADQEATCSIDNSTLAKFFLCGTGDDRTVSLSTSGSTYVWQKLGAGCTFVGTDDCPTYSTTCSSNWVTVGNSSTFLLDASNASISGEYRVRVDSGTYYHFKVSSNPLDPQITSKNIICGNSGNIEVTNVPAGYEYSLNSSTGPFQDSPSFDITAPGDYQVFAQLKDAPATSCIFPSEIITISEESMMVDVTKTDIICSGEKGNVGVTVSGATGFYSYRLLKGGVTLDTFGPSANTSHTFNNLGSGTYSVQVETNDCDVTVTEIAGDPITIGNGLAPIEATAFATDSFGCGATSVDVTLDVTGGSFPYRYSLDGGTTYSSTFNSSVVFSVNTAGTYNILIEDRQGCSKNAAVEVQNIPPPVFNVTTEDANCGGANNGRLTINVTNSNGYMLEYSNDNGVTFKNGNVFSNLAPGSYDVVVRYQQDTFVCTTTPVTETIGTPSSIVSSASATVDPNCANENGGEITFTVATGGAGDYEYSIGSGFVLGTTVFPGLSQGSTYTPQIRDRNGCVETLPDITFAPLNKPTDIDFTVSSIDCATGTASVTLVVTGGDTITDYEILAPSAVANGASNVFTGLGIGSYTFRVTDAGGCSYTESFAISDISSIKATAQLQDNVTCVGGTDGRGRYVVDGFTSTYTYQIDANPAVTGQTDNFINVNGLAAGSYTITVTDDDTSCVETATLTINEPSAPLTMAPIVTDMSCGNNNRGSVRGNATGGWGGYTYTLERPGTITDIGPRSNPNFTGLSYPGNYTLIVEDSEGCSFSFPFTLTPLSAPTLVLDNSTSDFCFDGTDAATINVAASGGDGNYEYRVNYGAWVAGGATNSYTNLSPGSYVIQVRDGNECIDTVGKNIRPQTTTTVAIQKELTCSIVPADGDAEIRVNISNGNTPYQTYEVSYNGGIYSAPVNIAGNSFVYTTGLPGTYQFRIVDNETCAVETNVITLNPTEVIAATANVTDPTCGDDSTGSVELIPDTTIGIAPYEYSADNITYTNQAVFSNLSPGNYTYYVRDSRGCNIPVNFTVGPAAPGVDATVDFTSPTCGIVPADGEINVTAVANGSSPFTYTLLDTAGNVLATVGPTTATTANFPGLAEGDYVVETTDASSCEDRDVVNLRQNSLTITPIPTPGPDCSTAFTFMVDIAGGTAPYLIGLVGETLVSPNVDADTHDFTGQVEYGITYFVEVLDDAGCRYVQQIDPLPTLDPLTVTATSSAASCTVPDNADITYEIDGLANGADIIISLTDIDTGAIISGPTTVNNVTFPYTGIFTNLSIGNYQVIVTEDTGTANYCNASALVSITNDSPTVVVERNTNANCLNPNGQLVLRGVGGSPAYTFGVVPTGDPVPALTTNNVYDLPPGTYDAYIEDSKGCVSVLTGIVIDTDPSLATPDVDVTNQCNAVANYTIDVTSPLTVAGAPETTYQYDIGNGFQDSPNFVVPNAGTYTVTVRNANGCTSSRVVEVFDFFSISASASSQPSCNNADGIVEVITTGGSGNFRYALDDGTTVTTHEPTDTDPDTFTGLGPGTYTITVTDLNSNTSPLCSDITTVEIITVNTPVIDNTFVEDVSCNGAADGSIVVELNPASATDAPFTYNIYVGSSTTPLQSIVDATFENLAPGTYQVEVVSDRGCSVRSGDILVEEPTVLEVTPVAPDFTCNPSASSFSTTTITVYTDDNGDGTGTPTGNGSYSYSLNDGTPFYDGTNFQSSNTFEIIDSGVDQTIDVIVRDGEGCETTETITILAPTDLTFNFNLLNGITCDATGSGASAGQLEIIIDQGPGNYEVEVLPLGSQPARLSNGTDRVVWDVDVPGDYIFAVRDIDKGACLFVTPTFNVPDFNIIDAVIGEVKPVSCFGASDGEISIEVNNYSGAYNYEVFLVDATGTEVTTGVTGSFDTTAPIATPEIITGLPAGNLIVRVEALASPFCDTTSNTAPVRSPDRALTLVPDQTSYVTCAIPGLGEITATADGGWGTYEYQLEKETATAGTFTIEVPFASPNIFSDLSEGNYRVSTRDSGGCVVFEDIRLSLPVAINADIEIVQPLLCPGANDGVIRAFNVSGGEDLDGDGEEYLFQLNRLDGPGGAITNTSGLQESASFPNLPSGYYTITIFDGWSCDYTTSEIYIVDPEPVDAELVEVTPPGCGDLGRMRLSVTNPVAGMEYFYRRAGTTDAFVSFGGPDVLSVIITIPDIDADPGPFQYDVQNGNGCPEQQSNEIGLDKALPLVVALDLVDAEIKCQGEATAIIRSEAFGGIGNYRYTLVNNDLGGVPTAPTAADIVRSEQASGVFRNLGPGTYYVYATSGGCTAISSIIEIEPKVPLELISLESNPVSCTGDFDGTITIEARGGTGEIKFSISDTLSEFFIGDVDPNTITFKDLAPGTYSILVQDEVGCSILREITVTEPETLIVADVDTTPELCINAADGTATLTINGGTPFVDPITGDEYYETSLNSSDDADFVRNDSLFFDNLVGGETYVVFIRDANLCDTNAIINIDYGVDLSATPIIEYGCRGIFPFSTVTIDMADKSLMSNLMFSLDVDDLTLATTQNVFGDLAPDTTHTVYIYHSNGCSTSVDFTLDAYNPLSLSAIKTGPNEITALAEGGYGGYTFFFQGNSQGNDNIYTLNEDDAVTIRVEDAQGCVAEVVLEFKFTGRIEIPNFFTPNGDNENDKWSPTNREFFPDIEIIIYDRYGRVVARLDDVTSWDGTYEGNEVPTGDYWYVINANDKEKQRYVGHFTLYR
ncbi:T9SS type B sorting domain-containing protein [Cellulophaga fucicola]|uniref:T9SS type B sorting domain-containing protein n=1 Tax=Cellulophaga fucicola TaxID=76595 RepID=UPI003EC0E8F3